MEIDRSKTLSVLRHAILAVCLAAIAIGLGVMVFLAAQRIPEAAGPKRKYFSYVALTSVLLLGATLVALGWVLVRLVMDRLGARKARSVTPYVDAWSLAGKRFKLEAPDEGEEEEKGREDAAEGGD